MRRIRELPPDAARRGQLRGHFAAEHGVSEQWLRLISEGKLSDPEFVRAIREAAKEPHLWAIVSPTALDALLVPTQKIELLGGTLDDLLAGLLDNIEVLQRNPSYASEHSALDLVNTSLNLNLEAQRDAEIDLGRRYLRSAKKASQTKVDAADELAGEWLAEVEARRRGVSKTTIYLQIANRVSNTDTDKRIGREKLLKKGMKLDLDAVKKRILYYQKKQKQARKK